MAKDFADVTDHKDLKTGSLRGVSRGTQCNHRVTSLGQKNEEERFGHRGTHCF